MRDHNKLRAFQLADEVALLVYRHTTAFPKEERYGLTSQMRRCAVSIASNIVEGCARHTQNDYLRFLDIAYGGTRELEYQISLAKRLNYFSNVEIAELIEWKCIEIAKVMNGLMTSLRKSGTKDAKS
ncbi:MAG: four helix bundle protein [Planctomycetaceae bacterium]|nr:four helix bundle protein [Planctomycetaceae bacterium]